MGKAGITANWPPQGPGAKTRDLHVVIRAISSKDQSHDAFAMDLFHMRDGCDAGAGR